MESPIIPNDNKCAMILQDGLFEHFHLETSENFDFIMKEYFSSDRFQKDFENGSWSGGIDVVVDSVPIGLDAGADSSKIKEFRERIESSKTLEFRQSFYQKSVASVANTILAQKYNDCIRIINQKQFGFLPLEVDISESSCTFTVRFYNEFADQPMPTVQSFDIKNAENIGSTISVGAKLGNVTIITCDRDPKKRLEFILRTNLGAVTFPVSPSLIADAEFINAVILRDLKKVQDALENKDADPNTILPVPTGLSVLMKAADNGDLPMCIILLASGADITFEDKFGQTPLYMAVASGNTDLVKYFLKNGANEDVNKRLYGFNGSSKIYNGWTPLKNALYQSKSNQNPPSLRDEFDKIAEILKSAGGIE